MIAETKWMKALGEALCAVLVVPVCAGAYLILAQILSRVTELPAARLSIPYAIGSGIISAGVIVWLHVSGETKTLTDAMRVAAVAGIVMACSLLGYFAFTAREPVSGMLRLGIAIGVGAALILLAYLRRRAKAGGDGLRIAQGVGAIIGIGLIGGFAAMRLQAWQLLVVAALCASLFPASSLVLVLRRGIGLAPTDAK